MFSYNLQLALKSLKERPALTLLTILAIATGLGLYTTVKTMSYQSSQVPLAHKSKNIFLLQMDNREITADAVEHQSRMGDTTYKDMVNLMAMEMPNVSKVVNWSTYGVLNVEDENINPIRTFASVTNHAFFTTFEPPFLYGNAWDKATEESGEAIIVISKLMNDQLFGGRNSVGEYVRINTHVLKIIGVLDTWHLSYRFYDRSFSRARPHNFFIPYTYALENDLPRRARFNCWAANADFVRSFQTENKERLLNSECTWIKFWIEVPDENIADYREQITSYIESQKALGRFPRELKVYLTNLTDQFTYVHNRNTFLNTFSVLATLFFAVCLLNAVGILLAKFMRRKKEVSLRRALGAKKKTIVMQHLLEVIIIGFLGGVLGIIISYFGLQGMMSIRLYSSDYTVRVEDVAPYFQLNWLMIANAFVTGIICTIVASIYPIWRLCNIPPASQLKSQ